MGSDELTLSEIVRQLDNPNAPKEVFDRMYHNQKNDLDFWGTILKPEYFDRLKEKVLHTNESVVRPNDVVRGNSLSILVHNILR